MFLKFFKKSKLPSDEIVFIHVPKTGGSTFVGLLKDSINISKEEQKKPSHIIDQIGNVQVKHIDFSTVERKFQFPELFGVQKDLTLPNNLKIFMLIRNPIDRMISEFNFQYHMLKGKDGNKNAAIISKLKPIPDSLKAYVNFKHTQNYQVKFLLGRKIADPSPVKPEEFNRVLSVIDDMTIHCGLTEDYSRFLSFFQSETGIKLKKKIIVRKKTPLELKLEVSQELKDEIIACNKYDQKLYEFVKNKLKEGSGAVNSNYKYNDDGGFVV
jgi:hypothetical protein